MNKKMILGITIVVIFTIAMTACSKSGGGGSGGGGKTLNSPESLKTYLDSQPANSPDKPIKVSMAINDPMLEKVAEVIKDASKYVSLNITGNLLTTIDGFSDCETLVGITIPSSVTTIESGGFSDCTSLASITIPSGVTSIGWGAFSNTAWYESQPDGLVYAGKVLYQYKGTMPANTVINNIRSDTIAITGYIFNRYTNLTSITIPSSVTSIGRWAFGECTNLTSITIPSSVTSIGSGAFYRWTESQTITIQGKANQAAADAAWGGDGWQSSCGARIVYEK